MFTQYKRQGIPKITILHALARAHSPCKAAIKTNNAMWSLFWHYLTLLGEQEQASTVYNIYLQRMTCKSIVCGFESYSNWKNHHESRLN